MASVTSALAQSSMLATLSHNGEISIYYGSSALRDAHAAAEHGDVITLSSGNFVSTNITKAVTIRGAGAGIDSTVVVEPTVITGDFNIRIADTLTNHLTLEGIYSNFRITYSTVLKNARFLKCRLYSILPFSSDVILKDASFIHCRIANEISLPENSSASCINSVISRPTGKSSTTSNFEFVNCVVYNINSVQYSSFKNCIVYNTSYMSSNCTSHNSVGVGYADMFKYAPNATNRNVSDITTLFKTYKGTSLEKLDDERFELTDAAQSTYLGSDDTQVGIYGGALPYDPVPTNPQITKCNVAAKSTADGKLSVDIEVSTAE